MALSIVSSSGAALFEDRHCGETVNYRNDAFSFWKLPENYRAKLAQATEASEPLIRRHEKPIGPSSRGVKYKVSYQSIGVTNVSIS